jgi:hypothetical protein
MEYPKTSIGYPFCVRVLTALDVSVRFRNLGLLYCEDVVELEPCFVKYYPDRARA